MQERKIDEKRLFGHFARGWRLMKKKRCARDWKSMKKKRRTFLASADDVLLDDTVHLRTRGVL